MNQLLALLASFRAVIGRFPPKSAKFEPWGPASSVESLNYHHLMYFWMVAREGSMTRAAARLHVTQPTLSSQIQMLEKSLGLELFRRAGRGIELTDDGQLVFRFADEIFALGTELVQTLKGRPSGRPQRFLVGVPDQLPKMVVHRLLTPALTIGQPLELVCFEGKLDALLGDLASHQLDLVISDMPAVASMHVRAFSHPLGDCGVTMFGSRKWARQCRQDFPASLNEVPLLLPTPTNSLRRSLDQWFDKHGLSPRVTGQFEDSALMKAFGQAGLGLFPAPTPIAQEICRQYGVEIGGRIDEVRESYFAISVERRLKHPAVIAITEAARSQLFAS